MTRKKIHIVVALTLALCGCTPPFHPPQPPSKEEMQKQFIHCFREEMQPTDEQLKVLQEKIFANDVNTTAIGDELKKANEALESGLESETPEAVLLERYFQVGKLRSQLSEDHFHRMLRLRSILTPEQRKKFLACKRKMGPPPAPHD